MIFNAAVTLDEKNQAVFILAVLCCSVVLCYYCKRRFFTSKASSKWKNPFSHDSRLPCTPLIIDQEKRNRVLKRAFTKKLVGEQNWDAIVIGSGPGGLSSAALLSKAGLKVLVLEKHNTCGGGCHTFKEEGYEFDVGIHFVGGFTHQTLIHTLFDQISDGQIQWAQMDEIYDRVILDPMSPTKREYSIPSGLGVWEKQLIKSFPDERKAIETFFSMVKRVNHQIKGWILVKFLPLWLVNLMNLFGLPRFLSDFYAWDRRTLAEVIESLTKNKDLQLLFTYSWGTYGTLPSQASFAMQALIHGHFEEGASYPIGGPSEIPFQIIPVIERAGGQVLMKAKVLMILTEDGKATGVRVGHKETSAVDIYAPIVISDAGILNTFMDLLPEDVSKRLPLWPLIHTMKPGIGCINVFIGLRGTAEELGLKAENLWILNDSSSEGFCEIFDGSNMDDVLYKTYPGFFIGCHSAKDPSWECRYPGRSSITVLTFAPYSWFAQWENLSVKKRGDEYNSLKNAIGQQIIDQIIHIYPHLQNAIEFFSIGTPITNQHYLNAKAGATYGLDHGVERFSPKMASLLRPETGIDGLFLCGQDVMSLGLVAAVLSGVLCASVVLKNNLFQELEVLHKKLEANTDQRKQNNKQQNKSD